MRRRGSACLSCRASFLTERTLLRDRGMHFTEHVTALGRVDVDPECRTQAMLKRRLVWKTIGLQTEKRIGAGVHGDVDTCLRKDSPVVVSQTHAVIENVVRTQQA